MSSFLRIFSIRCFLSAMFFFGAGVVNAQDPLFEFTGRDPVEPSNWQKELNWKLNGEPAARVPGTGPDDRVIITGFAVTNPSYTIKSLILGGSITGGFLSIAESVTLNGGAFNACEVTLLDHATLTSNGSGLNAFDSCIVNNRGVFAPASVGLGSYQGQPPTVLKNDPLTGIIELRDGSSIGSVVFASIESGGQIVKLSGPGSARIAGIDLSQMASGSVSCQSGTLLLGVPNPSQGRFVTDRPIVTVANEGVIEIYGGASELLGGASIAGLGKVLIRHAIVSGPITVENLEINDGGSLEGPGDITLTGLLEMKGGILASQAGASTPNAQLTIQPSGVLHFAPHQNGAILDRNVVNSGLVFQEMGVGLRHTFDTAVTPSFDNRPNGTVALGSTGGLGGRALNNAGIVRKIANVDFNSNEILSRSCQNSGLIEVQAGLLRLPNFTQTAGELQVGAGTEVRFSGSAAVFSGGVLSGSGVVRGLSSSTPIIFESVIRPTTPTGALTIIRGEDSIAFGASASIEIEIGGTAPGFEYDQLILNSDIGNFPIGGGVSVRLVDGFVPSIGQTFSVIRYTPARAGGFTKITGLSAAPGILLVPRYTSTSLDLVATADPRLRITSVTSAAVIGTIDTAQGAAYQIETSTDLVGWSSVGSSVTGDGQAQNVSLDFTADSARFFRVRVY